MQLEVIEAKAQMELRTPGHVRPGVMQHSASCPDLEAPRNAELFVLCVLQGSAGRGRNAHSIIQKGWSNPKALAERRNNLEAKDQLILEGKAQS